MLIPSPQNSACVWSTSTSYYFNAAVLLHSRFYRRIKINRCDIKSVSVLAYTQLYSNWLQGQLKRILVLHVSAERVRMQPFAKMLIFFLA